MDKDKMSQQFDLMLENRRRAWWIFPALPILFITNILAIATLASYFAFPSKEVRVGMTLLAVLGGNSGIYILLVRATSVAALLTLESDKLTVLFRKTGLMLQIPFASITSHQLTSFKGGVALRITFNDGNEQIISTSYHPAQLLAVAKKFEEALYRYMYGHDQSPLESSIPSFFRGQRATGILVGVAIALTGITFLTGLPDASSSSSFLLIMAYVSFIGYAAICASARRKQ